MDRIKDKVALVSGGGSGIGKAVCELFRNEGGIVYALGRREQPLKNMFSKYGVNYSVCDIRVEGDVEATVSNVINKYGKIDILVNNAGVCYTEGKITDLSLEVMQDTITTNIIGTMLLSKYVLRGMTQKKQGNIVNVSSILGTSGAFGINAYTASKGAINALTRSMAAEYSTSGIRVNSVAPSVTETEMIKRLFETNSELESKLRASHPNGKFLSPENVASTILFLASDESSQINGQNIIMDGGKSVFD